MAADQQPDPSTTEVSPSQTALAIGAILAVVAALYLVPVLAHDWPMNDGGLFYAMIGDIIDSGFALPDSTSYEQGAIPFAYPPLGFYFAAVIEEVSGLARAEIFRFLPSVFATAAVGAIFLLADEIGPTRRHALVSMAFFGALLSLNPAVTTLIGGGGLTRSMGLALAILATWQGLRMLRTGRWLDVALTSVMAGLAVLSHPQAGVFVVVALGAAVLTRWRSFRGLALLVAAAAGTLLVIAPWLVTVAARHGIEPFLSASGVPDRDLVASLLAYGFLFLAIAPMVGLLDIVGQVQQAAARRPHLLVWRIGVFLLDFRFTPVAAAAPTSLLAAHGVLDAIVPLAWQLAGRRGRELTGTERSRWRRAIVLVLVGLAFLPATWLALDATRPSAALSSDQRAAMEWVRAETPIETVTVSLASTSWGSDIVSEWFPALSLRRSASTSQGLEWVAELRDAHATTETELRGCRSTDDRASCVADWVDRHLADQAVVVFIDGDTDPGLGAELVAAHGYRTLWSSDSGALLEPA